MLHRLTSNNSSVLTEDIAQGSYEDWCNVIKLYEFFTKCLLHISVWSKNSIRATMIFALLFCTTSCFPMREFGYASKDQTKLAEQPTDG